ncbi:hypothetical protein FMZ60_08835 [Alcaligenaceae bacterium SJ-26]|nr:hypothetical protein FMZ60_08835 [Alcaligenaceae bacterium SJ-26]
MIYYRHKITGDVWALEPDVAPEWVLPELVEMSEKDVEDHLSPPTGDHWIKTKLATALAHVGTLTEISDEQREQLERYRDALLAVPQQDTYPYPVDLPTIPDFLC